MTTQFGFKRLTETAIPPKKGSAGAAGFDLCADIRAPISIQPGQVVAVPTGIAIELGANYYARIAERSGLAAKHSISVRAGVIDSDYRGEIKVLLHNLKLDASAMPFTVNPGDRIAQMIIYEIPAVELVEVQELSDTARGAGGFGSTGVGKI